MSFVFGIYTLHIYLNCQILQEPKPKTFTFMHLAVAFIQSDLKHSGYTFFCQYVCSLGIEPTTFALLTQYSNH